MNCRYRPAHRLVLIALMTAPLFLGTCAEMAIRISIDSAFDAADPFVIEFADQAGRQAGEDAARTP